MIDVPVDGGNLIRFLKKARNVDELEISKNQYDKRFFRELSRIQSIQYLDLDVVFPPDSDYDIGFLFKLKNMKKIRIETIFSDVQISVQLFIKFLRATENYLDHFFIYRGPNEFVSIRHFYSVYNLRATSGKLNDGGEPELMDEEGFEFDEQGLTLKSIDELLSLVEKLPEKNTMLI